MRAFWLEMRVILWTATKNKQKKRDHILSRVNQILSPELPKYYDDDSWGGKRRVVLNSRWIHSLLHLVSAAPPLQLRSALTVECAPRVQSSQFVHILDGDVSFERRKNKIYGCFLTGEADFSVWLYGIRPSVRHDGIADLQVWGRSHRSQTSMRVWIFIDRFINFWRRQLCRWSV